ncbi:HEAT repeat domain-containing protein [Aphanothece sacrum]|uniref:PBS lyase HEAT-like repeat protein n=1 Tax=Aphanothece sacrum FPU1 TaxID=1920663 RepID=A0A401INR0_APHSA|nr:HEAT repeat domain-containing protein [Aphanothece sacrum]GBF82856.1 PBS lyase HEAT-like repeat protein [Aphanothece sacrum FPU1]GBF86267.1 PBS lyase [Aphanothece sacrum FPU3]
MSQRHLSTTEDTSPHASAAQAIEWREVGRLMLKYSLPINPISTQPDEMGADLDRFKISLALIQLNQGKVTTGSLLPGFFTNSTFQIPVSQIYQEEEFFEQVLQLGKNGTQGRKIAIIGESGSGKTLMLQKIAHWVLEQTDDIPIWVSPTILKTSSLREYLYEKWLSQASNYYKGDTVPIINWQESFENLLNSGHIWFLLDGMDYLFAEGESQSPSSTLEYLQQQLQGWIDNSQVIVSCQTQTWQTQTQTLSHYELYKTEELSYPVGVQQFIEQCFRPSVSFLEQAAETEDLVRQLYRTLDELGNLWIDDLIKNPLRLALLCRLWQKSPGHLPQTTAQLYQQLIKEFYQWQAENITTTPQQQQQLNNALTTLALSAQCQGEWSSIISQKMIEDSLGEESAWVKLAVQLKWLVPRGVIGETGENYYYSFGDRSFQDYFASLAIDDWKFFFEQPHKAISEQEFPIFDPQWQGIMGFWLGREDIDIEQKEAFIQALITFCDDCGPVNFYGLRAYFLAVSIVKEFSTCSYGPEMSQQLIKWGFETGGSNSENLFSQNPLVDYARESIKQFIPSLAIESLFNLIESPQDHLLPSEGFHYLAMIGKGNPLAIRKTGQYLKKFPSESLGWLAAETLGIIDPGNSQAIATFINLIETQKTEQVRQIGFSGLEKIGKKNLEAINALVYLLHDQPSPALRRRVFQCLEVIGQGNATAIAVLVQLIRTIKDGAIRRQTAESLEKIDPGNPTAIAVLIQLTKPTTPEVIRREAVYSLGEVSRGNAQIITALVNLLGDTEDIYTRWIAVSSLGKIGTGNREAITALEQLLVSGEQLLLRKESLDSLGKIAPTNPKIIATSIELMQETNDEATHREVAEHLGKFDPGNPDAISVLLELLQTSTNEFTRRQAAASLGKIDPNNLESLRTLIQLIGSTQDRDIRSLATESLGEIGLNNPAAIATLIRLLQRSTNLETRRCAAKSLGKIAPGNKEAIAVLIKQLQTVKDLSVRMEVAHSLMALISVSQMSQMVTELRDYLFNESESKQPDLACYQVLWHCSHHLSYAQFYQAWHQSPLSTDLIKTKNKEVKGISSSVSFTKFNSTLSLLEQLQQTIKQRQEFEKIHLIWIDSSRFIEPDNPLIDIYDQMLEQGCSTFEYGLPETMAKLRLYWNILQRHAPNTQFIWLFYDPFNTSNLSHNLLEMLRKFQGAIAIISQEYIAELTNFIIKDNLIEDIIKWIEEQVT